MSPPMATTTVRISANFGPASQFENLPATFIQLKGRTDHEQGEIYLQLSLTALRELADLLENDRLSATDKATYNRAYTAGKFQYDQAVKLRDQLQMRKKSFRKFIVNLFVRESDPKHFRKITHRVYKGIKRTSEDLARRLLPEKDDTLVFGSPGESTQDHASVCEESLCVEVEVTDLSPNETIRGLNVDIHNEQEEQEVFATLSRIAKAREADGEEDAEYDDQTTKSTGTTLNFGVNEESHDNDDDDERGHCNYVFTSSVGSNSGINDVSHKCQLNQFLFREAGK
ncbi:uncharacterized protein F5891DRAFT_1214062 [Suillus fuscotomentosus]|uniref:Uncharacterized protein n=1 Tax=Suillus fuscotomentosus TaxID=1912939 RepID=A0AAD4HNJ0_9AGAM|nr:uncharacterized protein F5891DRAFT_1214062 [Suillus fuscotomentosus]KAG1902831.1 hypothetical protein F5891DRAFT_1214062 [Suillus fuscotomentosus]